MPVRVSNTVERSVKAEPPAVVVVVAATSKVVLPSLIVGTVPNINTDLGFELAARYIFNDTGGKMYYAIGIDVCDNVKLYHGVIQDQQMLDCSNFGQQVTVYPTASGNVAITILHRQDLFPQGGPGSLQAIRT